MNHFSTLQEKRRKLKEFLALAEKTIHFLAQKNIKCLSTLRHFGNLKEGQEPKECKGSGVIIIFTFSTIIVSQLTLSGFYVLEI
jgi:hypothetical protein